MMTSIREKGYEVPIIAVSARMEPSDRKKISASGINAFVQKPLNQQLLLERGFALRRRVCLLLWLASVGLANGLVV